jgi:hypothetical protein
LLITLEKQVVSQQCPGCAVDFSVVRGPVYANGQPHGLFLIALHGHSPDGKLAHVAIAISGPGSDLPLAAAIQVFATREDFRFSLVDWASSPWEKEKEYLGRLLSPEEVRTSVHRPTFFHIADHIVEDLTEVKEYFG